MRNLYLAILSIIPFKTLAVLLIYTIFWINFLSKCSKRWLFCNRIKIPEVSNNGSTYQSQNQTIEGLTWNFNLLSFVHISLPCSTQNKNLNHKCPFSHSLSFLIMIFVFISSASPYNCWALFWLSSVCQKWRINIDSNKDLAYFFVVAHSGQHVFIFCL